MRVRRTASSSLRTAALGIVAALTVALGIVAVPVAASAVAPIVIDDFSGTVTGTRSVDSTSPSGYGFTESGGVGIVQTYSPNGGSVTGTTLQYTFGSALDLTSNGNNTEFMIGVESVTRTGNAPEWESAVTAAISVTDTNGTTGVYNTGYPVVTDFNQIMNFSCNGMSACFTPSPDFHSVASITVSFYSPRNLSPDVTTIRLTEIRTTPTGGAQPGAPAVTFAPVGATSPRWIEGTGQLSWDVSILSDGQPASLTTGPAATSFAVQTTGTVSAGGATLTNLGNGRYRYTTTVSGAGTIALRAPAGIVTDNWAQSNSAALSDPVTIAQGTAPTISPLTATAIVGVAFSRQLSATGTPAPSFSVSGGQLPPGTSLSSSGLISGTPTQAGTFTSSIAASSALGSPSAAVTITVNAVGFVTSPSVSFTINQPADFTVRWEGPANTPVTVGGTLPDGIVSEQGDNSLHLTGIPTRDGRFIVPLTLPGDVTQTLTIDVLSAPVISGALSADGAVNTAFSQTYTSAGWPAPSMDVVGTLPAGLTATTSGSGLTVSGIPQATGTFTFQVRATNSTQQTLFPVIVVIGAAAGITNLVSNTNAPVGERTVIAIGVAGSPAPTVTAVSSPGDAALPSWLALAQNPGGGWELVATPDASSVPVTVAVTATNRWGSGSSETVVRPFVGPSISGSTEITAPVGVPLTPVILTVSGDPVPAPNTGVTVIGDLYGLQVTQEAGKVTFSGTPTSTGTSTLLVTATQFGVTTTHEVLLTITQAPTINAGADILVTIGDEIDRKIELTGYPEPSVAATGLPEGLSIVTDGDGTWVRGTVTENGEHVVDLTAVNGTTPAHDQLRITVNEPARITSAPRVEFPFGQDSTFLVTTSGYPAPHLSIASLPSGITFVDNGDGTGTVSGRPTSTGTWYATVTAANSLMDVQPLQIDVTDEPAITADASYDLPVGEPVDITITASGYPAPVVTVAGLPNGLTATSTPTGVRVQGTPTLPGLYHPLVTATNDRGTVTAQPTMTVGSAPVAAVPVDPRYRVGQPMTVQIATAGFPAPTITVDALPAGLSLTRIDDLLWQISGTPTEVGTTFTLVRAENGFAPAWLVPIALVIDAVPQFTSLDAATFALCETGTFTVTTTGYPNAALTASTLPDGLSFWPNADGTATITGAPTQSGAFPVTLTAANGTEDVTQELTITVTEPAAITGPADARFRAGVEGEVTITTTGFPVPELSAVGTPDGLVFVDNHDGTATLSGIPVAGGASDLEVRAANVRGAAYRTIPITVTELPLITSANTATVGIDFRLPVTVSGFPVPTVTAENLPAGVILVDDADGIALVGSDAARGVHEITLHADVDGTAYRATQLFTLTVEDSPRITSGTTIDTHVGDAIAVPVTTSGYPAAALSVAGLPDGITFADNGDGTGLFSGATTDGGRFTISVTAQNARGIDAVEVVVTSTEDPAITSADSAVVGAEFVLPITTDGFPAPELSADGLPKGVELTDVDGSPALVGTDVRGGEYTFTLHATNVVGTADQSFTLTVQEAPAFTSADTLTAKIRDDVQFTVTTTGFPAASIVDAGLPAGLTLTDNHDGTATISGTPTTSGTSAVVLTAANSTGSALQLLRITVTAPTVFTSPAAADFREGEAGSFTVHTEGFPVASLAVGALPAGLSFDDAGDGSATISGTPTAPGTYAVTITATRSALPTAGVLRSLLAAATAQADAVDGAVQQTLVITVAERSVEPTPTPTPTPTDPGTPTPTDPVPSGTASPTPTRSIPAVPASPSATPLPSTGAEVSGAPVAIVLLLAGLSLFALTRRRTHRSE
ncbi:beta strand repeat-containing protein [Microbacterium nymphoidis]|uniref:beta strand repeat-containing protein n=1 Tax=Microbacterium nymphoidis TaxID=2898586 RepID=UPI001E552328|nr:putative Ig domain-containing protein [Microbacterium nymphoidis]MCD2498230.1 putative Ig domain-containing protein [Microbacterium nymphoidis]